MLMLWISLVLLCAIGCAEPMHDISSVQEGKVIECKSIGDGYFSCHIQVTKSSKKVLSISKTLLRPDADVRFRAGWMSRTENCATVTQDYSFVIEPLEEKKE